MKHSVEHLGFPKTTIETVAELRQVAGQRFGTDTVVDSPKIAFNIDDQGLDSGDDLQHFLSRPWH